MRKRGVLVEELRIAFVFYDKSVQESEPCLRPAAKLRGSCRPLIEVRIATLPFQAWNAIKSALFPSKRTANELRFSHRVPGRWTDRQPQERQQHHTHQAAIEVMRSRPSRASAKEWLIDRRPVPRAPTYPTINHVGGSPATARGSESNIPIE